GRPPGDGRRDGARPERRPGSAGGPAPVQAAHGGRRRRHRRAGARGGLVTGALAWHVARDVRVDAVPEPEIVNPHDAIVAVTSTAICGSDLHLYNGVIPTMRPGDVLGHEFMGEV